MLFVPSLEQPDVPENNQLLNKINVCTVEKQVMVVKWKCYISVPENRMKYELEKVSTNRFWHSIFFPLWHLKHLMASIQSVRSSKPSKACCITTTYKNNIISCLYIDSIICNMYFICKKLISRVGLKTFIIKSANGNSHKKILYGHIIIRKSLLNKSKITQANI